MKLNKFLFIVMLFAGTMGFVACGDDDADMIPSYITIDAFNLENDPNDSWSSKQGFRSMRPMWCFG